MPTDQERHARFVDLVEAHQGAIRKVAAVYANGPADREDLVQEIVLQLWRAFDSFRGESAFSTFLYRVALNTALMRRRRASRRPGLETGHALEQAAAPEPARHDEDVERLHDAIRQLGPVDCAIVLLVLEERRYEEIAAVTGLTPGNVSIRLVRAKERLRRLLGVADPRRKDVTCSKTR